MKNICIEKYFWALVRAGLWPSETYMPEFPYSEDIEWARIYQLAEEQSVVGLVAGGIDHYKSNDDRFTIPQEWVLQFIGNALQIEERNKAMNGFVAGLISKMRIANIYAVMVKGQGIAQCYERPLWRASGDVYLLLTTENYNSAKKYLTPLASSTEPESESVRHYGMTIDNWVVELHGSLRSGSLRSMDMLVDEAQNDVFYAGNVRSVEFKKESGESVQVFLPAPDADVIFVFTHILKHFFHGGIGLRQICDWCRLLWTYRETLNHDLLESRLRKACLMSEWKAFASFTIDYLGMSAEAMPLYSSDKK